MLCLRNQKTEVCYVFGMCLPLQHLSYGHQDQSNIKNHTECILKINDYKLQVN